MNRTAVLLSIRPTHNMERDCRLALALAQLARSQRATVVTVAAAPAPRVLCYPTRPLVQSVLPQCVTLSADRSEKKAGAKFAP